MTIAKARSIVFGLVGLLAVHALSACDEAEGPASSGLMGMEGSGGEQATGNNPGQESAGETSGTGGGASEGAGEGGSNGVFGTPEDIALAEELLRELGGHLDDWDGFGKAGSDVIEAEHPHGPFSRYFANQQASFNPGFVPKGSIIVLHNLRSQNPSDLNALTVMRRIEGYNPDASDWFWAVFAADGTLVSDPSGVKLAGRITDCVDCHAKASGFDWVWGN